MRHGDHQDGVVVIHHDLWLNPDTTRGPDGKWLDKRGPAVSELTFAELQKYDVGRLKPGNRLFEVVSGSATGRWHADPEARGPFRSGQEIGQHQGEFRLRDQGVAE
jgi:hypothetical protein